MNPNPPPSPSSGLPPPPPPPGERKTNRLAIAALVMSILGLCLLPCLGQLAAIVLGIMALMQIQKTHEGGKGLAIAALVIPAVSIPIIGIMAAIAIPNFIKFQARSKQLECKSNLRALHVAQRSMYSERELFSTNPQEIGFAPEALRYTFMLSEDPSTWVVGSKPEAQVNQPPDVGTFGVEGQCPECSYTALCVGNVDSDETLDVWFVSSEDKELDDGQMVPAGTPHNLTNDVTE